MASKQIDRSRAKAPPKGGTRKKSTKKSTLRLADITARRSLMLAAKRLFANKGLSATTIRDIASAAKMNSSMISYYFDGKDGLYKECLREIGETRLQFARQILQPPSTKEELRIRMSLFIENLFQVYLEDREAGLLIIREYDRVNSPAEKVFKDQFLKVFDVIIEFFEVAQANKLLNKDLDTFILASLFFGTLFSQMRLDHLKDRSYQRSLKDPIERKSVLEHIITIFGV